MPSVASACERQIHIQVRVICPRARYGECRGGVFVRIFIDKVAVDRNRNTLLVVGDGDFGERVFVGKRRKIVGRAEQDVDRGDLVEFRFEVVLPGEREAGAGLACGYLDRGEVVGKRHACECVVDIQERVAGEEQVDIQRVERCDVAFDGEDGGAARLIDFGGVDTDRNDRRLSHHAHIIHKPAVGVRRPQIGKAKLGIGVGGDEGGSEVLPAAVAGQFEGVGNVVSVGVVDIIGVNQVALVVELGHDLAKLIQQRKRNVRFNSDVIDIRQLHAQAVLREGGTGSAAISKT